MGISTGDMSGAWVPAALGRRPRHKAQANKPCDNRLGVWNDKAKALVTSVKMGRLLAKPKPKPHHQRRAQRFGDSRASTTAKANVQPRWRNTVCTTSEGRPMSLNKL
jgi:hypothetical protein